MSRYKRILLKLSGESLAGGASFGINAERVKELATEVAEVVESRPKGIELGTTIEGGKPVIVPLAALNTHVSVMGAAGSGKTTLIKYIAFSLSQPRLRSQLRWRYRLPHSACS